MLTELSKAFDYLPHELLLAKLKGLSFLIDNKAQKLLKIMGLLGRNLTRSLTRIHFAIFTFS